MSPTSLKRCVVIANAITSVVIKSQAFNNTYIFYYEIFLKYYRE